MLTVIMELGIFARNISYQHYQNMETTYYKNKNDAKEPIYT